MYIVSKMRRRTLAQAVASLSVIISLLLVAYELRQNRIVAEQAAYQAFVDGVSEHSQLVAADPVLASLVARIQDGALPEDLTREDNVRMSFFFASLMRQWEGLFRSVRIGILSEKDLNMVGGGGAFANAYFRSLWPAVRGSLSEDFVLFVEDNWILE